jgi:hypothetical protein
MKLSQDINNYMVNREKKFIINEGRAITNGKFAYGGFPRVINENDGVTSNFQKGVATAPDDEEFSKMSFQEIKKAADDAWTAHYAVSTNLGRTANEQDLAKMRETYKAAERISKLYRARPEYVPPKFDDTDTHKIDTDTVVAASFGRGVPSDLESPQERGLRMGPPSLPPTDYDLGISGPEDRGSRRR